MKLPRYKIIRTDRASFGCPDLFSIVYHGQDSYGCANDDTRRLGIEYTACSVNESGEPFFTIPKSDIVKIS